MDFGTNTLGSEVSAGRETKKLPQARVERVGISHDINGLRGVVIDSCIGRTQAEALLDTRATTDLIRTDVARGLLEKLEKLNPTQFDTKM